MLKTILAAALIAGLGVASAPDPVDAAETASARSKRPTSQPSARRTAVATRADRGTSSVASSSQLRDRSTFNLANGRLNGREFFDQLNERATGAGE